MAGQLTAGQLTENAVFNFLDYCAAYISVLLGRCLLLSVLLFAVILLMRGVFFKKEVFLKGMTWGLFLIAPFLGKLRILHEMDLLGRWFVWWDILCQEQWWFRHGYLLGIVISAGFVYHKHRQLGRLIRHMEKEVVCGRQIYMNELSVTPFTAGLIHPRIIIPQIMKESFLTEELRVILLHEETHIRLGHLWFYMIWEMVQIMLWPNPMFIVCRPLFQADLESICDQVTIQKSGKEACEYGKILLKSIRALDAKNEHVPVTFAGTWGYRRVQQRFYRIAEFIPCRDSRKRRWCITGTAVLIGIMLLIIQGSYPRYTEIRDVVLADESGEILTVLQDSRQLRKAVSWDQQQVYINRESMDQILQEQNIMLEEGRFILGIGGYTKIPSMGGGGSIAEVDYSGREPELCISYYNRAQTVTEEIFKWML